MSELPVNRQGIEQEQQAPASEAAQVEVVIGGQVFKKTILPSVTREDSLGKRGGVKRMPPKSRELTTEEQSALDELKRDERSIYDRKFSDSGRLADGAPQGDAAWDSASRVNGAYTPDDYYLSQDERAEQQE